MIYVICESLFTNIQKHLNKIKISLLFKKFTNFTWKYFENSQDDKSKILKVLFLYENKHIGRFSNLRRDPVMFIPLAWSTIYGTNSVHFPGSLIWNK